MLNLVIASVFKEDRRGILPPNSSKKLSDNVRKLLLHQRLTADDLYQLQIFSFQLLRCKMEFSAAGLFSVNLSYLYSSTAAVIAYIVVLVQIK